MQKSFEIKSASDHYQVEIGSKVTEEFLKNSNGNVILICDALLLEKYDFLKAFPRCVAIEANEESKDLNNISKIILQLRDLSLKRGDLLVGVGGGVIQDITCFSASIYMRGVDWVYFPTTFLGMADSCIGGKSSINVHKVKNLVGNIYPPKKITIDIDFVKTLSPEQVDCGLFEAIKICYASFDLEKFLKINELLDAKKVDYLDIISLSLKTKKWFIEIDEFDVKERQLLNFGHTFGHAIESSCAYKIPHGIAVGIGMLWEIYFSKIYFNSASERMLILENLIIKILANYLEFNRITKNLNLDDVFNKFTFDKKHKKDKYICILIDQNGLLERAQIEKDDNFIKIFKQSFKDFISKI